MLEQKRKQFWNRQRILNKSTYSDFRFSLSCFCYFRLNNENIVFFPYNFYIPIENVMWIENRDEIKKSERVLLLRIVWRFQNWFCFCSGVIRYWVLYFWKWVTKKKSKKEIKNKKSRNSKKVHEQNVFYIWFYVCTPNFTKVGQ